MNLHFQGAQIVGKFNTRNSTGDLHRQKALKTLNDQVADAVAQECALGRPAAGFTHFVNREETTYKGIATEEHGAQLQALQAMKAAYEEPDFTLPAEQVSARANLAKAVQGAIDALSAYLYSIAPKQK